MCGGAIFALVMGRDGVGRRNMCCGGSRAEVATAAYCCVYDNAGTGDVEAAAYSKAWKTRGVGWPGASGPTALRDRAIILTLVDTGIRASELCALRVEDYDESTGRFLCARAGK